MDFSNLNKLEEMIALNEQNHHLKDFLADMQIKNFGEKKLRKNSVENFNVNDNSDLKRKKKSKLIFKI